MHHLIPSVRQVLAISAVLLVTQLSIGTSPAEPPYHAYIIAGTITRPEGRPRADFVVRLAGRFAGPEGNRMTGSPDSAIRVDQLRRPIAGEQYPGLTDADGNFSLKVATFLKADSVAVEVSSGEGTAVRGGMIPVHAEMGIAVTSTFQEGTPSCAGCGPEPAVQTRILGYEYALPPQTVALPL